jgi:hypothetical protein
VVISFHIGRSTGRSLLRVIFLVNMLTAFFFWKQGLTIAWANDAYWIQETRGIVKIHPVCKLIEGDSEDYDHLAIAKALYELLQSSDLSSRSKICEGGVNLRDPFSVMTSIFDHLTYQGFTPQALGDGINAQTLRSALLQDVKRQVENATCVNKSCRNRICTMVTKAMEKGSNGWNFDSDELNVPAFCELKEDQ